MNARFDKASSPFASELVLVGADSDLALPAAVRRVADFLSAAPGVPLEDVAYTCALESAGKPCVLAVVADSCARLRERLRTAGTRIAGGAARVRDKSGMYYTRERLAGPGRDGRIAFLFPGTASFYPDMLRDLAILFPTCRKMFDELEEAIVAKCGFSPASFIFPPGGAHRARGVTFPGGGYAQAMTATCAADLALVRLFRDLGVEPGGVAGFGGGDVSALAAAGVTGAVRRADRLAFLSDVYGFTAHLLEREGLPHCVCMHASAPGAESLAAAVAEAGPENCAVSFSYSPRQCVVAARAESADAVARTLAAHGVRTMRLPQESPFNTPWCAKAVSRFKKFADRWSRKPPSVPVYSCADAEPLPDSLRRLRNRSMDLWTRQVRFDATILRMYDDGFRVFLELGPRGNLSAAADDILRDRPHAAIAANRVHRSGLLQLHHALAQLAAAGVPVDAAALHADRRRRRIDFDFPLAAFARGDAEMRLSRAFPRLALFSADTGLSPAAPAGRAAGKAALRAAAVAERERKRRQFDFGAADPLVSDAETLAHTPGVSMEIAKTLDVAEAPFISDCAFGTSQLSYSEPSLRGLTILPLSAGCEMMGELARQLVPARVLVRVEDLAAHRAVIFSKGRVKLFLRAERAPSRETGFAAVKVQLRDDSAGSSYTWPVMEAVFLFAEKFPRPVPTLPPPLPRPRSVHWTDREIYPSRLRYNGSLRAIRRADSWSETGLDYEVETPAAAGAVSHTRFPLWVAAPLLMEAVVSGFDLWRSHARFAGAFAAPFRIRRISFAGPPPAEGSRARCYLRLASVTPRSHIADITVSDGNGNLVAAIEGLEELVERVPEEYPSLILSPASTFLTRPIPDGAFPGANAFPSGTAMVVKVPYAIFERHGEIWLRMVSSAVLCPAERMEFAQLTGTVSRRAEWLFGRIAAKDAVRRFMEAHWQARWACADIQIWPDDSGKPHALGAWADQLQSPPDITIAHTSRLVVAAAAANARIGLDVEARGRDLSDEFTRGVFTPGELERAAAASAAPDMMLRFWCAKEAVSKSLGTGIRFSPREMEIVSADPATGALAVRLGGGWLAAFKNFAGRDIRVSTTLIEEHVLASCFLPSSLFES